MLCRQEQASTLAGTCATELAAICQAVAGRQVSKIVKLLAPDTTDPYCPKPVAAREVFRKTAVRMVCC